MRNLILLAAASLAAGSLAAQDQPVVTSAGADYSLRPEDLSGQFQVNEDGALQYPLLGDIDIRGLTVAQLRGRLRSGLENLFTAPFVTITPLFRIAVLGEVRTPGLYTVDPTLSVLDIVAMAGGPTPSGNLNQIRLLRSGAETRVSFEQQMARAQTLQEVGVRSGDEIVVPRRFFTRSDWVILLDVVQIGLTVAVFVNAIN
jgi:polysaccharide export outer membrane protein